ncbi:unnamed protein product [[Candida] boidinii]|nr:hypothetical protein BVG19_g5097 [[Candida] boidinii]OWB52229.1 hypothetical protein B5S27_g3801 [[Candida] boidinii]OWB86389.1 hypothetical protein B5S33_g5080 [[Candida] boidinii]GMF05435.1 unnamed protein product [[Candida] boidinii]
MSQEKLPEKVDATISVNSLSDVGNLTSHISTKEQIDEIKQNGAENFELYLEAQNLTPEEIEQASKKVLRKLDMVIMPLLCITYTLQFLDKLSLNYAAAYTFKEDLGLTGQRYSWVAAIFNFGYMLGALPANYLIQKFPVAKFTGCMIFIWAILLLGHIGCKNYGGILVIRFLLGILESCISPSCMLINVSFYKKSEQPLRMCCFLSFNGVATMVGALLSYGLGHADDSHLKTWKLIFLTIGLMNLVWSVIFLWLCPDTPKNARFLTETEKIIAVQRVSENMMGVKNKKYKQHQLKEGLLDYKTWLYSLIGLATGVINGGCSNFLSALIKGFGFSSTMSTLLQLPTGGIEFVVVLSAGIIAVLVKNTRCLMFILTCLPGFAGLIGLQIIPLHKKWALVGCTWLQYVIGGPVILCWIWMTANVAGQTKRTLTNGLWFLIYAAGNIIGANIFYTREAPRYHSGLIGLLTCYAALIVLGFAYRAGLEFENRARDKKYGVPTEEEKEEAIINGFKDMTDKENVAFRYVL